MPLKEIVWKSRAAKDQADLLIILHMNTIEMPKYRIKYFQLILHWTFTFVVFKDIIEAFVHLD